MKKFLLLTLFFLPLFSASVEQTKTVYICTGTEAYAYHSHAKCSGLNRCKGRIKEVTLTDAIKQKRRACKKCHKQ